LRKQTQAKPYIRNYLALVLRQVLLNQLDEKIQSRYRFELEHMRTSERYFKRYVSLLAALQMINTNGPAVDLITEQCLTTMDHKKHDIVDYVKYAAHIADSIFDPRVAHASLERIRSNFHPGLIPLGAEVELSNLGAKTINAPEETDKDYDCFWYFGDFCLDVLSWKVGGYIDDHTGSTEPGRQRGFFELAPGRLNVARELSRPATADPWLLSQLIQEIVNFYNIRPHSLHLSFQLLKKQIGCQKNLPMEFAKCLLAIGGGLEQNPAGGVWISRIGKKEIIRSDYGEELLFARTSKRRWYVGEDEPGVQTPVQAQTYIQQYKFIRLEKQIGYEPLIMCLKGLQLAYNPGDYLTVEQLGGSKELRQQYEELKKWALKPAKIGKHTINRFVGTVHDGLMNERRGRPAHKLHYIDWAVSAIDMQLQIFNMEIGDAGI